MFQPDVTVVRQAAAALGWAGEPVRVRFGGEDVWAVAGLTSSRADRSVQWQSSGTTTVDVSAVEVAALSIAGVLVTGTATSSVAVRASVFAGYAPRAVLVPEGPGVLALQVTAAMLGQGVVVVSGAGLRLLSAAESAQPGVAGAIEGPRLRLASCVYDGLVAAGFSRVC